MPLLKFSLRTNLILVAIVACFAAFLRMWFGESSALLGLLPLVLAVALVTVIFLVRAVKRRRTSALGLIGVGALAAFSTTSIFGLAAATVWSAHVYADESKGFLISPWIIVLYFVTVVGSIAAVVGGTIGGLLYIYVRLMGDQTGGGLYVATGNQRMQRGSDG